jgi:F-type H+-transporting ATPase subunit b
MEFVAELVGFVVILFVLWRYVLPPVANMVKNRQDEVQRQVDEAEEATRKLEEAQGRFDNAVKQAEAEGARIRDDARADATRIREELKEQAEAEVERMLQRGREQLVADRDQAVRRLNAELGGASIELAERLVRTTLDDEGARGGTVESFLSEIESLPSPRGSVSATTGGGA